MATLTLTAQDVNGDPFTSGGNINIVNGSTTTLTFTDSDYQLASPLAGEFVSLDGGVTQLSYSFLGYGDVRGDLLQNGAFIRVDMGDGTFQTYALDMNADGDQLPTLSTGNTKLTVAGLDSTSTARFPAPACFLPGTRIATRRGPRRIETLREGDLVLTMDNGLQPLRRLASETRRGLGDAAPVRIARGALRNERDLWVSQQHGILLTGWRAELHFGEARVLVPAKFLVNGLDITIEDRVSVTYLHLVLDRHEMVFAEGIASESLNVDVAGAARTLDRPFAAEAIAAAAMPRIRQYEAALLAG